MKVLLTLIILALSVGAQSININGYGADSTGAADSWKPFQRALDDAGNISRAYGGSGALGDGTFTINPTTGTNASWYGFLPTDAGTNITIERDLGLPWTAYPLRINQVFSPTQCTLKTAQGTPVIFASSFSNTMALWKRQGPYGKEASASGGQYKLNQSLQMLTDSVCLTGESRGNFALMGGTSLNFGYTTGIIQRTYVGADARWFPMGPGLIPGAESSYHLTASDPGVYWDYMESLHVERYVDGLSSLTLEFFYQPVGAGRGNIISLFGTLPDQGQETALQFGINANNQLVFGANLNGTVRYTVALTPLTIGTSYHIAGQVNNGVMTLFVNGIPVATQGGLAGQTLVAKPYQQFTIGAVRGGWPVGGMIASGYDCYVSHIRLSRSARYPDAGFTAPTTAPVGDGNTMLLDEGQASQQSLFLVDVGGASPDSGYQRFKLNRHLMGDGGFMESQKIRSLKVYSRGAGVYARRTVGTIWQDIFLQSATTAFVGAQDTFSNQFLSMSVSSGRAGLAISGPSGICTYQDISITAGKIGAFMSHGSGVITNWYVHGPSQYQIMLDTWEGSIIGTYFSNEDASSPTFQANLFLSGSSDLTISGSKFETYAYPRPSVIIGNIRTATFINGMFESNAGSTEILKITGTPKAKIMMINPTRGRFMGNPTYEAIPLTLSPSKMTVVQ